MTSTLLAFIMAAVTGGGLTKVIEWMFNRKKQASEQDSLTTTAYKNLLDSITGELNRIKEKDIEWEKLLSDEQEAHAAAHDRAQKCHVEMKSIWIELRLLRQLQAVHDPHIKKFIVHIVDDMPYVLEMYKARLGTVILIDLKLYPTVEDMLTSTEFPDILIMNYVLEEKIGAATVIQAVRGKYGKVPKVIITANISTEIVYERLDGDVWKVVSKNGAYIVETSTLVMDYIREVSL